VKAQLAGVALLAAAAAACGGHSGPGTRLTIEVGGTGGVHAYRLECDPARGDAPHPALLCSALRREPRLLVGGRGVSHSCPARAGGGDAFRVSGTYRGYRIDSIVPPPECTWVPGQEDAADVWSHLMEDAGPGRVEHDFAEPPPSAAERARRRERSRRLQSLQDRDRRLTRVRVAALDAGRLRLRPGQPPDPRARNVLRDYVARGELVEGPTPARARVYATTRRRAERQLGFSTTLRDGPVYLLLVQYSYRDYRGRSRLAEGGTWSLIDARTLEGTDGGLGPALPSVRLGRAMQLRLLAASASSRRSPSQSRG
jgi:hypothetical protein